MPKQCKTLVHTLNREYIPLLISMNKHRLGSHNLFFLLEVIKISIVQVVAPAFNPSTRETEADGLL